MGTEVAEGKEGAFKTIIHYYLNTPRTDWSKDSSNNTTKQSSFLQDKKIKNTLRIHGAQIPEGSSYTAGWPLTQNGNSRSDYQVAFTSGNGHFYWVSWQVLSGFNLQTYSVDFQDPANPKATYGMYHYCKNKAYWFLSY